MSVSALQDYASLVRDFTAPASAGSGTVTSVNLSVSQPAVFTPSGGPVTGTGTLNLAMASQPNGQFLASPPNVSGIPSFRGIVEKDIEAASNLTTKGDIECFSGHLDRLPVGVDGQVVYADSSQLTGLNWKNATFGQYLRVADYGAIADGKSNLNASISSGSSTLTTVGGASFSAGDVGKTIVVAHAGAAGVPLQTTIAIFNSSTSVGLNVNASTTVVNDKIFWGTDNTTAISNAIAATSSNCLVFDAGTYCVFGSLGNIPGTIWMIRGQGSQTTTILQGARTPIFQTTTLGEGQSIGGFQLRGLGSGDNGNAAILFNISAGNQFHTNLFDLEIRECGWGVFSNAALGSTIHMDHVDIFDSGYATCLAGAAVQAPGNIWITSCQFVQLPLILSNISITSTTTALTSASPVFSAKNIGQRVVILFGGVGGATYETFITAVASTTACTVSVAASTTVTNGTGIIYAGANYGVNCASINPGIAPFINGLDLEAFPIGFYCSGTMTFGFFSNLISDACFDQALLLQPGAGSFSSNNFVNCWFNLYPFPTGTTQIAVQLDGAGTAAKIVESSFNGCRIMGAAKGGMKVNGATALKVFGSTFDGNTNVNNTNTALDIANCVDVMVLGNDFSHRSFNGGLVDSKSINLAATVSGDVQVGWNQLRGSTTALSDNTGTLVTKRFHNNIPYNPQGPSVTTPSVPATTVAQNNTTGVDCTVYINGGTLTDIKVGGVSLGLPAATTNIGVGVPAGSSIALTYSVAPTWKWIGV